MKEQAAGEQAYSEVLLQQAPQFMRLSLAEASDGERGARSSPVCGHFLSGLR